MKIPTFEEEWTSVEKDLKLDHIGCSENQKNMMKLAYCLGQIKLQKFMISLSDTIGESAERSKIRHERMLQLKKHWEESLKE